MTDDDYVDYDSEAAAELNKNLQCLPLRTNLTGSIDLGFCPVSSTTSRAFWLENPNA